MKKILAGVVLFNPDSERLIQEVLSICDTVSEICFFDNGSEKYEEQKSRLLDISVPCKMTFLEASKNMGIGYAFNRIFEYAQAQGYSWVLTLDHDTVCPAGMVEKYRRVLDLTAPGMFCPSVVDREIANNSWQASQHGKEIEEVDLCIQSGALISVSAWKTVSGFDEIMFIDFVDFDFCKRLKVNGYKIIRCNQVEIDHELGKREQTIYAPMAEYLFEKTNIRLFKYLTYRNVFSNARAYYSARNNIIYIHRYWNSIDRKYEIKVLFSRMLRKVLRGKNKLRMLYYSVKGSVDGVKMIIQDESDANG